MYFDSLRAVVEMDGHGAFVWSAYVISLTVIGLLVIAPYRRRRRLIAAIKRGQRREEAAATTRRRSQAAQEALGKEESMNAPGA